MNGLLRRRPSPALIVAVLALIVALGGTGYAAVTVTGAQIRNNTITGADIKNRSLLARDFKAGQLPAGRTGPQGADGAAGPRGDQGLQGVPGPAGANGEGIVASASITRDGAILASRNLTSVNHDVGEGNYLLAFRQPMDGCHFAFTLRQPGFPSGGQVVYSPIPDGRIMVHTLNKDGEPENLATEFDGFSFVASC